LIMEEQRTTRASRHFKPKTSALVLIDHQVGTMQLIKNLPSDVSLRNAVALAKAAKAFGMPIVMTSSQESLRRPSTYGSSALVSSTPGPTPPFGRRCSPLGAGSS
jgi:nicotinamidase-related amidase